MGGVVHELTPREPPLILWIAIARHQLTAVEALQGSEGMDRVRASVAVDLGS